MKKLSDCRVLLVDDTKANLDILVAGLKSQYKLNVAMSGHAALQLAGRIAPDLILLDVMMPELDGYEVCRQLRARPETRDVPVIFVSALGETQNKALGFEAGGNDYITKPFDLQEVKARVNALLKAKAYNDAVKAQIAGELRVAREIQMGMVPHDFSSLAATHGVQLAAQLMPAGEVGGDLYAAFGHDAERLVVVMGDVSGKGVPAALFMVRTLSMVRLLAREIADPAQILARLNDELAADNPFSMFVTLACAVYEPASGRLVTATGGQAPPIVLRSNSPPRYLCDRIGTALGLEPRLTFCQTELTLDPSDTVVWYTDGVTEAFNQAGECYGGARLLTQLESIGAASPESITSAIVKDVQAFAAGAQQSDDIAVLALRAAARPIATREFRRSTAPIRFHATRQDVMHAVEAVRAVAREQQLDEADVFALSLALEECATNIVQHACHGDARLQFSLGFERVADAITICLRDEGDPLDPSVLEAPLPGAATDEGGWGLHLARSFIDDLTYRREAGQNVWRLTRRVTKPDALPPAEQETREKGTHCASCH